MDNIKPKKMLGIILVSIFATFLLATTTGVLSINQKIPSAGTILTINMKAYTDSACTQQCTQIDFGTLNPGETSTKALYVKNTGTTSIILSLEANNWNPVDAGVWLSLSWDREDQVLMVDESILVTVSLSVDENIEIIEYFDFDIIMLGTQVEQI